MHTGILYMACLRDIVGHAVSLDGSLAAILAVSGWQAHLHRLPLRRIMMVWLHAPHKRVVRLTQDSDVATAAAADPWGAFALEQAAAGSAAGSAAAAGSSAAAAAAAAGDSNGGGGGDRAPKLFKEFELLVEPEPEDDEDESPEVQR